MTRQEANQAAQQKGAGYAASRIIDPQTHQQTWAVRPTSNIGADYAYRMEQSQSPKA